MVVWNYMAPWLACSAYGHGCVLRMAYYNYASRRHGNGDKVTERCGTCSRSASTRPATRNENGCMDDNLTGRTKSGRRCTSLLEWRRGAPMRVDLLRAVVSRSELSLSAGMSTHIIHVHRTHNYRTSKPCIKNSNSQPMLSRKKSSFASYCDRYPVFKELGSHHLIMMDVRCGIP